MSHAHEMEIACFYRKGTAMSFHFSGRTSDLQTGKIGNFERASLKTLFIPIILFQSHV